MVGEVIEQSLGAPSAIPRSNVRARIASSAVLATLALGANYLGGIWFAGLVGLIALAMSWEWGRVVRQTGAVDAAFLCHSGAVLGGIVAAYLGAFHWSFVALLVGAGCLSVLVGWSARGLSLAGILYVGLPALALVWFRSDEPSGALAILFLFIIVWMTDSFAYVFGKLLRGPRLWPSLSGRKTWAGFLGGILAACAGAYIYAVYIVGCPPYLLVGLGFALSIIAQAGDLLESALKRHFAVKNTSNLIPGHGGVMDRMDGIVGAVLAAALLVLLLGGGPPAMTLLMLM